MQSSESIASQQKCCRERAQQNGHPIDGGLEFYDEAISGTKRHRAGLDAMLEAASRGEFRVLYFFNLARLARECVITMPLLKRLVYIDNVRVISVADGIDSARDNWELLASILAVQAEQYIKELGANVFRGQSAAVEAGYSVGDYCFGYTSEPVPGTEGARRGRHAKPRRVYVVDPASAVWVARIFHWFVHEKRELRWIARELNRLGAPKDHRATTPLWHHQQVSRLLANRKYVGVWPWGEKKNKRDPFTGNICQDDRAPEECEQWVRHFAHLELIDRDEFERAQQRLEQNRKEFERNQQGQILRRKEGTSARPHLLSMLVACGHCGKRLHVGGANGRYLYCPDAVAGACPCRTRLQRARAERLILDAIGSRILQSEAWTTAVFEATLQAWHDVERQLPNELASAERALAEADRKIGNLLDRIEERDDAPELGERLKKRRREKQDLERRLESLRRSEARHAAAPTGEWVLAKLQTLGENLAETTPAACEALAALVGGKITVTEIQRPGKKRHFLQGRLLVTTSTISNAIAGASDPDAALPEDSQAEEIVIDFVEPTGWDDLAERVKQEFDRGLLMKEVAVSLGIPRSRARKALRHWFEAHGETEPNLYARRQLELAKRASEK